jgi:alpha-galactosidase
VPKVALIGAGSVEFTRNCLADLLTFPELKGELSVALHDVDPDRLTTAERVARVTDERTGAGARIDASLERRAALEGADYVINEIQVGGYAATLRDFEIPKRYGVRQTIADTLGVGGIFRGLRTIPVMVGIGNDMAELCPHALLLNYANPMAMVPRGVYEGSRFSNVVGVCHSVRDTHSFLAHLVGVPQREISFTTAGPNHQAFVLRFERDGADLYPRLREIVDADPEGLGRRVRVEIFKRFGFFPTESSEHSSEYVAWFLPHEDEVLRFRIPIDDYVERSEENLRAYKEVKATLGSGESFEIEPTSELASEVIHAIETGEAREVYGNVRNDGLIDNLPSESCVEVPCLVDSQGVHPQAVGALPDQLAALNRTFLNVADLTVKAALEGRRDLVYQAAMLDPNTGATLSTRDIVAMCDDLIDSHGDLLPDGVRRR